MYVLPPPADGMRVAWAAIAAPMLVHAPVVMLSLLAASDADEAAVLLRATPPLLRAAAVAAPVYAAAAIFAPLSDLRVFLLFAAVVLLIGVLHSILLLPLAHAWIRRPLRGAVRANLATQHRAARGAATPILKPMSAAYFDSHSAAAV